MKKKIWVPAGLIAILIVASFVVPHSSSPAEEKKESTCCKENMKECPAKPKTNSSGQMIIETLSRQFIAVTAFSY